MISDKEKLLRHPLTLIFAFFFLLSIYQRFGPQLPIALTSQEKGIPLVVEGTGKIAAVPDIAKVSLGIEESGVSLAPLQKSVNEKSKKLVDSLKKLGVGEREIKTTSYTVFPESDYGARPPKIIGYRVGTTYEVVVKDFDKINEVIAKATEVGANMVGSISFEVNEETRKKLLEQAREEAVKVAKEKAENLARAAGVTLGRIINIQESPSFEPPIPIPLQKGGLGGEEPQKPQIEPGETEISVTVILSFEIR